MYTEIQKETSLFEKRTVAELSDLEMIAVDGGTTLYCVYVAGQYAAASSEACALAVVVAANWVYNQIKD